MTFLQLWVEWFPEYSLFKQINRNVFKFIICVFELNNNIFLSLLVGTFYLFMNRSHITYISCAKY